MALRTPAPFLSWVPCQVLTDPHCRQREGPWDGHFVRSILQVGKLVPCCHSLGGRDETSGAGVIAPGPPTLLRDPGFLGQGPAVSRLFLHESPEGGCGSDTVHVAERFMVGVGLRTQILPIGEFPLWLNGNKSDWCP